MSMKRGRPKKVIDYGGMLSGGDVEDEYIDEASAVAMKKTKKTMSEDARERHR